jgi:hypothetical protein
MTTDVDMKYLIDGGPYYLYEDGEYLSAECFKLQVYLNEANSMYVT